MLKRLIGAALMVSYIAPSHVSAEEGFRIDITPQQAHDRFLAIDRAPRVGDLAVGERGYIFHQRLCRRGDHLGVPSAASLQDSTGPYFWSLELTREPGGRVAVALAVHDDDDFSVGDVSMMLWQLFDLSPAHSMSVRDCGIIERNFPGIQILEISSLDGYRTVSAWLDALQTGEHPLSRRLGR